MLRELGLEIPDDLGALLFAGAFGLERRDLFRERADLVRRLVPRRRLPQEPAHVLL